MEGVSRLPLLLLPPSESKVVGGRPASKEGAFDDVLAGPRHEVTTGLRTLLKSGATQCSKVMKVRGPLLERALLAARAHVAGGGDVLPAWQRYEGVVWSHLDPATLTAAQRRRILVPSGLYGITAATDEIEDYRLTMNVSLPVLGNVATFWRPHLTEVLRATKGPVVSLLPNEHAAAFDFADTALAKRVTHIDFVQNKGGRAAGHDAKAVKGIVARVLLEGGIDALEGFSWRGWEATTNEGHWEIVAPFKRQV